MGEKPRLLRVLHGVSPIATFALPAADSVTNVGAASALTCLVPHCRKTWTKVRDPETGEIYCRYFPHTDCHALLPVASSSYMEFAWPCLTTPPVYHLIGGSREAASTHYSH